MTATAVEAPRATRREWMGLLVIALPCMLYSMDLTVLNLALLQISADLKPTGAELLWIVDIYGVPEFRDPEAGRLDVFSAALSLAAVLGVIYALKRMVP